MGREKEREQYSPKMVESYQMKTRVKKIGNRYGHVAVMVKMQLGAPSGDRQ